MPTGYLTTAALVLSVFTAVAGFFAAKYHYSMSCDLRVSKIELQIEKDTNAHNDKITDLERGLVSAQNEVSKAYLQGKQDAEESKNRVITELRSGNIRLRNRWQTCAARKVPETTPDPARATPTAADREESAGRIVRAAALCDAQVRGLQKLLTTQRSLQEK